MKTSTIIAALLMAIAATTTLITVQDLYGTRPPEYYRFKTTDNGQVSREGRELVLRGSDRIFRLQVIAQPKGDQVPFLVREEITEYEDSGSKRLIQHHQRELYYQVQEKIVMHLDSQKFMEDVTDSGAKIWRRQEANGQTSPAVFQIESKISKGGLFSSSLVSQNEKSELLKMDWERMTKSEFERDLSPEAKAFISGFTRKQRRVNSLERTIAYCEWLTPPCMGLKEKLFYAEGERSHWWQSLTPSILKEFDTSSLRDNH